MSIVNFILSLRNEQFSSIFYNHSTSYCFSLYYKLLFGIDVDDFGFFANENYNEIFFDNNAKNILSLIAESDELKKLISPGYREMAIAGRLDK